MKHNSLSYNKLTNHHFKMLLSKYLIGILFFGISFVPLQSGIDLYENYAYYQMAEGKEVFVKGKLLYYNVSVEATKYPIRWILETRGGSYPIYDPRKRISKKYENTTVFIKGKQLPNSNMGYNDVIWPGRME